MNKENKKTKYVPNRSGRRAMVAQEKNLKGDNGKRIMSRVKSEEAEKRRAGIEKRTEATIKRRITRDEVRQKIAKENGVNWKRIVLVGVIVKGRAEYVIKKGRTPKRV